MNVDSISPEVCKKFLISLTMALHCGIEHPLTVENIDDQWLISMCDENCNIHFEIWTREDPGINIDYRFIITSLCSSLLMDETAVKIHPNGLVVMTARDTFQMNTDKAIWLLG